MLGAIIGDIAGSRFEFHNHKSTDFELFTLSCRPTDDSTMTLAVALALLRSGGDRNVLPQAAITAMRELGGKYRYGYGSSFRRWLFEDDPKPYGSWGNGAGMRVSPCGWAAASLEEALALSDAVTGVTHDHPEGLKGARAIAAAVFLARQGASRDEIRKHIVQQYYALDFTLDEIRPDYRFDVSCQGSVPQAIEAFLESASFEHAIRLAISIGGDSDTIAAMTGAIAGAFYGIPEDIRNDALVFLDEARREILFDFEKKYCF